MLNHRKAYPISGDAFVIALKMDCYPAIASVFLPGEWRTLVSNDRQYFRYFICEFVFLMKTRVEDEQLQSWTADTTKTYTGICQSPRGKVLFVSHGIIFKLPQIEIGYVREGIDLVIT